MSAQRAARRRLIRTAQPADDLAVTVAGTGRRARVLVGIRGSGHVALTAEDVAELRAGLAIAVERLASGGDRSAP